MKKLIGLWIDHRKAVIAVLTEAKESIHIIKSDVKGHFRMKGGSRSSTSYGPQDIASESNIDAKYRNRLKKYYQRIIDAIQDADKILIFGPGEAKTELKREMSKSRSLAARIVGVETEDKMTENQIMARVKQFYRIKTTY